MDMLLSTRILNKVVKRLAQGAVVFNNIKMGSSFSRSYSPNSGQQCKEMSSERRGTITRMESNSNYVEQVVCNQNDLNENEMKVFDIGEDQKVLIVKQKGEINAIGTKCTHYGAPLVSGALGDGRIRCPWHGACFNIKTGDIEDFPGFDSLPCYQVTVSKKGDVKVRAKVSDLTMNKRVKDLGLTTPCDSTSVVIVGAGPSGATCAETLRNEGYNGRITVVSRENYLPYDRIKLSKLTSITEIEKLQIRNDDYYRNANIEFIKGVEATKVEPATRTVHLSNGSTVKYSSLYLATGSKARVPPIPGIDLQNIFTVRDYNDSINIIATLGEEKDKNVVVLGMSFIGLETAASYVAKSKSLTVVGQDDAPLAKVFGKEIGQSLQNLFTGKGVRFVFGTTITKCNGENGEIKSVELANGNVLDADMLILGVGTTFYTDFLKDSGIALNQNGAVVVNEKLESNVRHVFAGGDIAYAPVFAHGNEKMSIGHVGLAQYHGRIAALNILKKEVNLKTVPFFWTMLFGKSIRYAGCGRHASLQVEGDVGELKFVIFFFDDSDKVIAVASCQRDPVVAQFAELLAQGKSLYKKDLKDDTMAWTRMINP